jgi:hypothetical protein
MLAFIAGAGGCKTGLLKPGEWGQFRYFGELEGAPPLRLLPPLSDRDGNAYVLYEDFNGDSVIYTGQALGGWSVGCQAHELPLEDRDHEDGELNVHGFLGASQDEAWYWAGDALVNVSGATGQCTQILDTDPLTVTDLQFVAAIPWVWETPSRRTLVAMVRGVSDRFLGVPPYQVVVDLDLGRYVAYDVFQPSDAECVDVLGVGGSKTREEGVFIVAYTDDGERIVEARFVDAKGRATGSVALDFGAEAYDCVEEESTEPRVTGFIQANKQGVWAGLLDDGTLVAFNKGGGSVRELPNYTPTGLVRFGDHLWVSGMDDTNRPVVGKLQATGNVVASDVRRWASAEKAAQGLEGKIEVLDQRYSPSEPVTWKSPTTAIGAWPFLSPFPLDQYANDTTGWLIAGPSYESASQQRTAIAYAPVGISVP